MGVDLGIWGKLTQLVIGLVVIAILLLIFMCYRPLIQENERMRRQILEMNGEIKLQQQIATDLSNQIYTLTYDPKTVERMAREKLGYARPDETVIHFEPAGNTVPPPGDRRVFLTDSHFRFPKKSVGQFPLLME